MPFLASKAIGLALLLLVTAVCLMPAPEVWAQDPEQAHARSRRLERMFDFEETDDRGNKIGFAGRVLPRHWYIVGRSPLGANANFRATPLHDELIHREGYPDFAEVGYDREHKVSGDFSLHLGLTGGQTGAFVQVAAITAFEASDYMLTGWVRTDQLQHAWAEVRVYFIDNAGRRIATSVHRSEPFQTDARWQPVSIRLPGEYDGAAYIGVELLIMQPDMDEDSPLGDRQIVAQDIDGGAWFDDIALWKLPHLELRTQSETNIITEGENTPNPPTIAATVRDLSGERLLAELSVYNEHLDRVAHQALEVRDKQANTWSWTPQLPGYGWYFTQLVVSEDDGTGTYPTVIEHTYGAFLYLPESERAPGPDMGRFLLSAEEMPDAQLPLLGTVIAQTGQRGVVLSAWDRRTTEQTLRDRQDLLEPIIRTLSVGGGRVVISLHPLPLELVGRSGLTSRDPLAILRQDDPATEAFLKPVLGRHGQRVSRWQIGSPALASAYSTDRLGERLDAMQELFRSMAPSPDLIVPWRLYQPAREEVLSARRGAAMAWGQGFTPQAIGEALDTWASPPDSVRLDIEIADAIQMRHDQRVTDLVLRMIYAWEQQVGSLALPSPWTPSQERRTALLPDPVLGAWVNTARRLEGQRVVGWMPLRDGLKCMILDGNQGGMLAVWNEQAQSDTVDVSLYLGDDPIAIDVWGNRSPIESADGRQTLTVGRRPIFIIGIDAMVARMRAGFTIDDPFIESTQSVHRRTLTIRNPWARTINGHFTITGPEGWEVQPRLHHFSIAPGGAIQVPLEIQFPVHEIGGPKNLTADFTFQTDQVYNVTLQTPLELGLRNIEFEGSVVLEPGRTPGTTDAVATISVTNTGSEPTALYLFASLPQKPRRELLIPSVQPGEFVTRRIRFTDVAGLVGEAKLRCGVREANGPAILNHLLDLDTAPPDP